MYRAVLPPEFYKFGLAPFSSRYEAQSIFDFKTAKYNGVSLSMFLLSTLVPARVNHCNICSYPFKAALCIGVCAILKIILFHKFIFWPPLLVSSFSALHELHVFPSSPFDELPFQQPAMPGFRIHNQYQFLTVPGRLLDL